MFDNFQYEKREEFHDEFDILKLPPYMKLENLIIFCLF